MTISQTKLFELLNAQISPPVPFSASNVELINPIASAGASWNSRLTMRALAYKGYKNEANVFYTRVDLALLGTQEFQLSEIASAAALVAAINTRLNAWLDVSDLAPFEIPADEGEDENLTLTAVAGSLGWIGQMDVTLKAAGITFAGVTTSDPYDAGDGLIVTTTFALSDVPSSEVSFDVATASDTAIEGDHFTHTEKHVVIPAGQNVAYMNTPVNPDSILPVDANFKLNLTNVVGITANAEYNAQLRPGWNLQDGRVIYNDAGARVAHFGVYMAPLSADPQTVDWQTGGSVSGGTPAATPGVDYTSGNATISFIAGQRTSSFEVPVRSDDPASEVVIPALLTGNSAGSSIVRNSATARLRNDQPIISVSDGFIRNGGETGREMVFTVSVSEEPGPTNFNYFTGDEFTGSQGDPGTAIRNVDYLALSGGGYLGPGFMTSEVAIALMGDPEDNPYFFLEISQDTGMRVERFRGKGVITSAVAELTADDAVFEQIPGVVIFEDNFNGTGFLADHAPDVNTAADAAWDPTGTGVYGTEWGASGRDPNSPVVADGRLVTPSPNSGPTILAPGQDGDFNDNTPPPEVRVGTYTVTWDWKSPRDDAGDSAYGSFAYPWQLSVGKSDITLASDGYRAAVGASINGDVGGPRTLSFYDGAAVPVTYEADTVYSGKMIVEPGKRTLEFLGVTLEQLVPDETVDFLIVGPLYLHLGENASLGFIKVVTGIA